MAVSALLAVRSTQYQTITVLASSTQEACPVVCTLFVCIVERKGHCIRDTVVKGAEWVENKSIRLIVIPNPKSLT